MRWGRVTAYGLLAGLVLALVGIGSCVSTSQPDYPNHPDNLGGISSYGVGVAVDRNASVHGISADRLSSQLVVLLKQGGIPLVEAKHRDPARKAIFFVNVQSVSAADGFTIAVVTTRLMRPLKRADGKWVFGSVYFDQGIAAGTANHLERHVQVIAMLQVQKLARAIANKQAGEDT